MSNLRFLSLSSGSFGNCYFLSFGGRGLLIDAGISLRSLKHSFERNNISFGEIEAVLVTHDHLDHIRHLGSFCKKLGKPVYAAEALHKALANHTFTRDYISSCRRILDEGKWNDVAGMQVRYFPVPHDASFTCGFAVSAPGCKFAIMTDAGRVTDEAVSIMKQADVVVVESNYDTGMLIGGPYPHELKMRICGGNGHLSNDECASAVRRFYHKGMKAIFLCHLSENNNTPALAYDCSYQALRELGVQAGEVLLKPLPRTYPSPLYIF